MNNLVYINDPSSKDVKDNVVDFLNPDYVYIPMDEGFKLNVKDGANIYKEDILLKSNDKLIYSPISGKILGKTESVKLDNDDLNCIVIQNDFKEKVKKRKGVIKYINEYKKEEIIELINKYNACDKEILPNTDILVINGIDKEPFAHTYSYICNTYSSKILEAIDALSTILNVTDTYLAINIRDTNNVLNLTNNIGTYPNIKLKMMPNYYPIGDKTILLSRLLSKKQQNMNITYLTVEDVYNIYNVLKRKKPITEKLVTISGNALVTPIVVNVKIGTNMADLIKSVCEVKDELYYVTVNGLISGSTLKTLNNVITYKTKSIFLNTKDTTTEKKCINCGLCNQKCPVGLNPKYIMEHKKADKSKCINCGLCTYICPSKINFKKYLGGNDE